MKNFAKIWMTVWGIMGMVCVGCVGLFLWALKDESLTLREFTHWVDTYDMWESIRKARN